MGAVHVGLVTHPRSRFDADGTATRQAQDLADALGRRGAGAGLLISDRDDYDPQKLPLGRAELRRSARYQADLEYRWRRYLADGGGRPARSRLADEAVRIAMTAKRVAGADRAAAVRLLNIDLSHLRVMDAAAAAEAAWTLVLEDDAQAADVAACAASLAAVIDSVDDTPVQFVNLSESLPLDRLGVDGLLSESGLAGSPAGLVAALRPVTNTVCANLYRMSFLTEVAAGIRDRGLVPVAPIDWRVNEQIMRMWNEGTVDAHSCAWTRPGLFLQGSMHAAK